MLIMICGDGDASALIYVIATKSIRAGNLECWNIDGEKYHGILRAELE